MSTAATLEVFEVQLAELERACDAVCSVAATRFFELSGAPAMVLLYSYVDVIDVDVQLVGAGPVCSAFDVDEELAREVSRVASAVVAARVAFDPLAVAPERRGFQADVA